MTKEELARVLGFLALAAMVIAGGTIGVLHFVPPTSRLDPYRTTISQYSLTDLGWIFNAGVLLLSVASLLLVVALLSAGQATPRSVGSIMLTVWAVGLAAVVVFEKTDWTVGPSFSGQVHRVASFVAFIAMPIGALWVIGTASRRWRQTPRRGLLLAGLFFTLGAVAYLCYLGLVLAVARTSGTPWWQAIPLGFTERVLVVLEVAALLCLAARIALGVGKSAPEPVALQDDAVGRIGATSTTRSAHRACSRYPPTAPQDRPAGLSRTASPSAGLGAVRSPVT